MNHHDGTDTETCIDCGRPRHYVDDQWMHDDRDDPCFLARIQEQGDRGKFVSVKP